MSARPEEEFINVLVLGSSAIKISYFIKLFSAYLNHDSYKEVMLYEPDLNNTVDNVKETTRSTILIGKQHFHFIDTPGLQKSAKNYKEMLDILLHFRLDSRLNAIILLIEPDVKGNENYFEQYTTHFLSGLKKYTKNILYVVLYNDTCMLPVTYKKLQKAMNVINMSAVVPQKCNMFHLHEDTFYEPSESNWEESVHFCRDVYEYITGNGLKSFYVHCAMPPEESFINLIKDFIYILLELLFLTEISKPRGIFIKDFYKNVTTCVSSSCWIFKHVDDVQVFRPNICHESCNCTQSILDVEACSVFQTDKKKCSVCSCDVTEHRTKLIEIIGTNTPILNVDDEKSVVKSVLIQLLLFIKKYVSNSINELSDWDVSRLNLEAEIEAHSKTHITLEKVLVSIQKLFEIKEIVRIFAKVINENFPDGLRLDIAVQPQANLKETKSYEAEYYRVKRELDETKLETSKSTHALILVKKELDELKLKMSNLMHTNNLSSNKDNSEKQNLENKLNIPQCSSNNSDEEANNS